MSSSLVKNRAAAVVFGACSLIPAIGLSGSFGPGHTVSPDDLVPVSADQTYVLTTDGFRKGLKLTHTGSGASVIVSRSTGSGYYATLSGGYVCYKAFEGGELQVPVLYDIAAGRNIPLADPAPQAGTPAVGGGTIAYTLGNELLVLHSDLSVKATFKLGHHVNTLAVSPDGASVAYSNRDGQITVLDIATGSTSVVTDGEGDYWGPQFSPAGDRLLATSSGGKVVAGSRSGKARTLGQGQSAGWLDNNTVGFTQKAVQVGKEVVSTDFLAADVASGRSAVLSSVAGDAQTATAAGKVLVTRSGSKAVRVGHGKGAAEVVIPETAADRSALFRGKGDLIETHDLVDTTSYKYLSLDKYIHQNNDTPDYWNGNSCCSAASSIMAMQYYNILPKHPMTASWPTPHTSDYGWYIPSQYTFNGYSYTYGSPDPNGTTGYGGFGYITRNNWVDTKGYMRDYITQHGPTSAVDWSPTMAKARTEIDGNKPFVVLNSLTAAGHYIVCMGYYKSQSTLIFWDPYGNKNSGSYPSANGRDVRYDWPGYNNGYQNLNTVHCYIWCRFTPPAAPGGLTATASGTSVINLSWNDNSSCEEFYDIYRSTSSTSGFTKIASVGTNTGSYSSTGLAAATTYYYQVKARTPAGSSAASNTASATTGASSIVTIVVDNSNAGFSASANWSTGTSAADKYGSDYRFRSTAAVSDPAVWTFNLPYAATADISAWWSAGTNRSASAPYILPDGSTVTKNQQTGGGAWQLLGTKACAAGVNTVKLSCWTTTGYVVMADAIKVVTK